MKKAKTPSIFIIMGVTGDLAYRKIIPSFWHLYNHNLLPDKLAVIGFSRRDLSNEEFKELVKDSVVKHSEKKVEEKDFSDFFSSFSYSMGTFEDKESFDSLKKNIDKTESSWGICANKLFYLAAPPPSYKPIFDNLAATKLNLPCGGELGWTRILIEKPFGTDLNSAIELQKLLSIYFKEEQIYRIDHYLFKEIIQGIENFRFSNNLFENTWDNTTIERIDIRLLESIGVKTRGSFYDAIGTFRDVGQNHLLAMLSAIAMDYPIGMETKTIHKNRADILDALSHWTDKTLKENTFRGQYEGYKEIKGVNENSETETYFALKTKLTNSRWKDVPIFMESGKKMKEARKEIILTLKHPPNCLLCEKDEQHEPNRIVFRLEPNDEIIIHFWTKKPGFRQIIEERTFSFFLYKKETKVQYVEEYSKIIHTAINGDQTRFISQDEIESAWKFTDPVVNAWKENLVPLTQYKQESTPHPKLLETQQDKSQIKEQKGNKGELGIIGLGKMGANLARQLNSKNWKVVGFNQTPEATKELEHEGIAPAYSIRKLISALPSPRVIWLMVPHKAVNDVLEELAPMLEKGDTIIDGGNSLYKESVKRSKELAENGINFLDAGVSGGPSGAINGACIMVGGEKDIYEKYESIFKDLSVPDGYGYMGLSGAGHFVKMIHNGIEYGMMQAIGEGFEVLREAELSGLKSPTEPKEKIKLGLDLKNIVNLYNKGSVIESRLVGWLASAYEKFGAELNKEECCSGKVSHSGEGQWTVETAHELGVPVEIIEGALEFRKKSQENPSYTGQVLSALRNQFGGHKAKPNNYE